MGVIAATGSSSYGSIAALLQNQTSAVPASADAIAVKPTASGASSPGDPADSVQLSDRAKAILARAKNDRAAADKLSVLVQALRTSDNEQHTSADLAGKASSSSSDQVQVRFEELAGITRNGVTATAESDGYRYEPKVTFSDTLQFNGFFIHASANADSWNSDVQISGPNGFSAWNTLWGGGKDMPTAGGGGGSISAGTTFSSRMIDNKLIVTVTSSSAAVSAIATQDASGSAFQGTAAARSSLTSIVVDFESGRISAMEADASAAATATQRA